MNLKYFTGTAYIVFGIIKLLLTLVILYAPFKYIQNIPLIYLVAKADPDKTLAGKMYEYVVAIFALFSLFYGLAMVDAMPIMLRNILLYHWTEFIVMMLLGIFLLIFYSLVLYTSLQISKKQENKESYILFGLGSGLSFIILPIVWRTIIYSVPLLRRDRYIQALGFLAIILVTLMGVGFGVWYVHMMKKLKVTDVKEKYIENQQVLQSCQSNIIST